LALLAACILACACGSPPDDSPQQQTRDRLVGTWLREYQDHMTVVRRVLVLDADGRFSERVVAGGDGPRIAEHEHAGEWRFDGTNLKRRYTKMDGKQPAAPIVPFATLELRFASRDEFVGIDNVHGRQVRYRRVLEGTLP
jgi:hypothetical protein